MQLKIKIKKWNTCRRNVCYYLICMLSYKNIMQKYAFKFFIFLMILSMAILNIYLCVYLFSYNIHACKICICVVQQ